MDQRIKVGDVYLELPKGTSFSESRELQPQPQRINAEKPDTPEPLEEPQYIYRPNDPVQSSIDEARAIASINASHKPWIKKTWFVIFVIGPLIYAELYALSLVSRSNGANPWEAFITANLLILPIWFVYYSIWRKRVKK